MMTSSIGWSKPTTTTPAKSSLTAPTQRVEIQPESTTVQQQIPLLGFVDIRDTLHGDNPS